MTLIRRALLLLFCLVPTANVWAVSVNGLYDATVPVPSTSSSDRPAAFSAALSLVMQRVAGSADILQQPGIVAELKDAGQLVQSYRYETVPAPQVTTGDGSTTASPPAAAPSATPAAAMPANGTTSGAPAQTPAPQALQMVVSFGPVGVNKALASAGASVWGANRPQIVVWAALDSDSGRMLITPSTADWASAFQQAADTWGLPLVLPRYDAQDQQAVNLSEVWGQFMDSIQQASKPYHADEVVAVRLSGSPGSWQANWRMQGADLSSQGSGTADTPADLVSQLAQAWASQLAQRFAVAPSAVGKDQSVELAIRNVNDLDGYAAVRRALRNMTPIESVEPVSITPGELVLRVQFLGELNVLQQYVALDHRFKALDDATPTGQPALSVSESPSAEANQMSPQGSPQPEAAQGSDAGATNAARTLPGAGNGAAQAGPGDEASPATDSAAFSTLYPRLHYIWQGAAPAASPGSATPPPAAGAAQAPGAVATPASGNVGTGSGSP
ncbi:DUF2066 domain-containing protein [Mangrovitalea sediminis]|uniref:DUF2066 domain-containing protein n=1 Tax=Mangrovitalea sediminis TaxID=1982043 RepID=UPI0013043D93|nr:DUF2066 domain-containing protein [Mangrovitalea sediminis]